MSTTHTKKTGYTLVELVVAVGLFALIMTLVSGAYIVMINLTERAQGTATGIDNLSFTLETMTRTIRTGSNYSCGSGGDCMGGATFSVLRPNGTAVSYALSNGVITQNAVPLTDPSVTVSSLKFYASGTGKPPSDYRQPYVTIIVSGTVSSGSKGQPQSFTVETSAAMRGTDVSL